MAPALFLIHLAPLHRFLSAIIVLSTILHRCSTSRTCTLVAVRLDLRAGTLLEEEEEEHVDKSTW